MLTIAMTITTQRALLLVLVPALASADDLLITGCEDDQLVCVNAFRPNELAVNDLAFDPGGLDEGKVGDTDTITLGRPSGQLKRFEIPHLLAAGVEVAGLRDLTVEVGLWCQQATWDYGVLGIYWNGTHIGSANTNQGATRELKVFSFTAPAAVVREKNVLWMMPTAFHRRIYLDAVKITGDGALTLTDAHELAAEVERVSTEEPPPAYDPDGRIDYVFLAGDGVRWEVERFRVDLTRYGEEPRFPSDHRALSAEATLIR